MPTGLPLDLDNLLAPVGDAQPAGSSSVYFELRPQLEDLRREVDPADYDLNDPTRPEEAKHADWTRIEELTRAALAGTSKDLRLAGYLLEGLVHRYGFQGLRDGLGLLREMLEQCWDRMYPVVRDGDLEVRAGVFNSLDDLTARGRTPFPHLLRTLPLVEGGGARHGVHDWKTSQQPGQEELAASFARALQATPPERGAELTKLLDECTQEVDALAKTLEQRLGPEATHLPNVRAALADCQRVVKLIPQNSPEERPQASPESDNQADGRAAAGRAAAPAASRAEAYRQLSEAAALLQRLEPHSPIPYLVQRAVELGALPFPQMIKALIRDANVLGELNRELGIKGEE